MKVIKQKKKIINGAEVLFQDVISENDEEKKEIEEIIRKEKENSIVDFSRLKRVLREKNID